MPKPSRQDDTSNRTAGRSRHWAASSLGAVLAAMIVFTIALQNAPHSLPTLPTPPPTKTDPVPPREVVRAHFFDAEVEPRIIETDALNRESARRCVTRLGYVVDNYRDGVGAFTDDLTSISTRLGIVRRMPGNWWKGDKRIDGYVQRKFEQHLFSKRTLMRDVAGVLDDFRSEVDANQKRMLVSVQASLSAADLPEVDLEDYEPFFASVAEQLQRYSTTQGTTSVYNGLTVLAVSEVGSFAAISVVSGLLARFGSAAAAATATGVGATAGTTAAGAGGGSLAGPVGTVVGLGAGLAVGLVIDWWMTEQFETKMRLQMTAYLDSLEQTLLHGSRKNQRHQDPSHSSHLTDGGIADALPVVCDRLRDAYRERFYQQIVARSSP